MAIRGGMSELLKQVNRIQAKLEKLKEEMEDREVEAASGGGMVTAKANGNGELKSISIEDDLLKPEEKSMLEDLVVAAVNAVLKKAGEMAEEEQTKITGGLKLPGMF